MLSKFINFFSRFATGRNVLISAGVYMLISILFRLLWAKDANGDDVVMLDTCFGFTPDKVYTTIGSYGEEGRHKMLILNRIVDSIYPFVYITFDMLFIIWLYRKSNRSMAVWKWLCIIPPITFVTDFFENIPLGFAIDSYPAKISNGLLQMSAIGNQLKWLSTLAFVLAAVVGVIWALKGRKMA